MPSLLPVFVCCCTFGCDRNTSGAMFPDADKIKEKVRASLFEEELNPEDRVQGFNERLCRYETRTC